MEGTVKFYNRKKGFGFINGDDGKDYFVHVSALPQGLFLRENDRVSFSGVEGDRGLKAEKIQLLQKGSERAGAPSGEGPAEGEEVSETSGASEASEEESSDE